MVPWRTERMVEDQVTAPAESIRMLDQSASAMRFVAG
jgi:hypothetical protein